MKIALAIIAGLVAAFAAVTYAALETGGDVAIVETQREDATTRTTHVWFVRNKKELWLEAGSSSNGWFIDVEQSAQLGLTLNDRPFRYTATVDKRPATRKQVRRLLRDKYGWRDWWVGHFIDQEETIPVLLNPVAPEPILKKRRSR